MSVTARNLAAMKAARRVHRLRFGEETIEGRGVGLARFAERLAEHPTALGYFSNVMSGEELDVVGLLRDVPGFLLDIAVESVVDMRDIEEDAAALVAREEIASLTVGDAIDFYTDLFNASLPVDGIEGVKKKLPEFVRKNLEKAAAERKKAAAAAAPASE